MIRGAVLAAGATGLAVGAVWWWRRFRLPGGQLTVGRHFLREPKGLLFDVDGTLIDTMPHFLPSWHVAGAQFGLTMTEGAFYSYAGLPLPEIVRRMHREQKGTDPTDAFVHDFIECKKKAHEVHEEKNGPPPPIACVARIAREAVTRGIPVAVATSGVQASVERHLAHCGLDEIFNSEKRNVVFTKDVAAGKPAPDIYIEAARRIGVDPRFCRAFEDGESGLMAAHAAGCHVVDVTAMDEYPMVGGLRRAKARAAAERSWA